MTAQKRRALSGTVLLGAAIALGTMGIVRSAWLCDDAYITLRTIDNWVHGYGLRWNVDERVQTYTHPLWMFFLSAAYAISHEPYYTTLLVSIATATAGLIVLGFGVARTRTTGMLAVLVVCASHAFIDYSTSGLENPLSDLLIALFAWRLFRCAPSRHSPLWMSLCAALLVLNRSDYVFLVGPVLGWQLGSQRSRSAAIEIALGLLPLFAWELFAFVYYGSLVPNTAYAKLNHHVPHGVVLRQGLSWAWFTMSLDWATAGAIVAAAAGAIWRRDRRGVAWTAGCVLYVGYTISIGGDFMGGRFMLAPFLMAMCYLAQCPLRATQLTLAGLLASTLFLPLRTASYGGDPRVALGYRHGVWDERHTYFSTLGLLNAGWHASGPLHEWGRWGADEGSKQTVAVRSAVGMHGYYAGPRLHIIDDLALCDPLLARLRPVNSSEMSVGHFGRHLPRGYYESVSGNDAIVDPSLREYYQHLQFITRGPIWSARRLRDSLELLLGRYDHLLRDYETSSDKPG